MTLRFALIAWSFVSAGIAGDAAGLAWMNGCWAGQAGPVFVEESWNKPVGGQMMGISRTIKGGKVVFSEFMRIEEKGGEVTYTPRIGTKAALVLFTMTKQSDTEVIFENPKHDFPQRIIYRKTEGGLLGRIDGTEKGKQRAEDFPMKAVSCRP